MNGKYSVRVIRRTEVKLPVIPWSEAYAVVNLLLIAQTDGKSTSPK